MYLYCINYIYIYVNIRLVYRKFLFVINNKLYIYKHRKEKHFFISKNIKI